MTRIGRLTLLSFFMAALVGLAGCGQNNEETAGITGVANPEVGSSPSDYETYSSQMSKKTVGAGEGVEGYPGQ